MNMAKQLEKQMMIVLLEMSIDNRLEQQIKMVHIEMIKDN